MMTGIEFINIKKDEIRSMRSAWRLGTLSLNERSEKRLKETLNILDADEQLIKKLIKAKKNDSLKLQPDEEFRAILETMSDSIKEDLNIYTNNKYKDILDNSGVSILESGDIHAGCIHKNDYEEVLNGYAIFINLGTYYSLQLLAKTIIIENLINEFKSFRRRATEFIDIATEIYIYQDSRTTRKIFFHEYPDNLASEASAAQSAVAIKVMQFIALHELGHIVNGDLEIMGFHKRFMNHCNDSSEEILENINISDYHKSEFNADMFAFEALFDNDSEDLAKWSSFYPVFYFLVWLDAIERKFGEALSNQHPNALLRAKKMHHRMLEITNQNDLGYNNELENVILYFNQWVQSMNVEFIIHTHDKNWVTNVFNKEPSINEVVYLNDDLSIRFISKDEIGKGFGKAELAITVIISMLTGVASGVIANTIYDKIMDSGNNKIIIREKKLTLTTKQALIEYIDITYKKE